VVIAADMVEVGFRDLFGISLVMGVMSATMATMLLFFYTGLEGELSEILKVGGFCGGAVASITLIYGGWRLIEIHRNDKGTEKADIVSELRKILSPIEAHAASLSWAGERPWRTSTHVKSERGTVTLDFHDLDLAGARRTLDLIIENRPILGRIRLVTGKGKNSRGRAVIRPMVNQRLDTVAHALDWQIIGKAGSITLRPLGRRPTVKQWCIRFLVFVAPFTVAMSLSFEELAGSGAREQGRTFGAIAGVIMTGLLASYRERT
tara:strand:- start:670 stop:1458 length:789 start_codon:yes stop_codon:yes gene_type:complete